MYSRPLKVVKFQKLKNARIELSDQEFDVLCSCSDDEFIEFVKCRLINNLRMPNFTICVFNGKMDKSNTEYRRIIEKAYQWDALFKVIVNDRANQYIAEQGQKNMIQCCETIERNGEM